MVYIGTTTEQESEDVKGGGGGVKGVIGDECTSDEVTATDEVTAANELSTVVSLEGSGAVKWQWKFGGDGCGIAFEAADGVGDFGAGSKMVVKIAENGGGILFGAKSGGGRRTEGVAGCKIEELCY